MGCYFRRPEFEELDTFGIAYKKTCNLEDEYHSELRKWEENIDNDELRLKNGPQIFPKILISNYENSLIELEKQYYEQKENNSLGLKADEKLEALSIAYENKLSLDEKAKKIQNILIEKLCILVLNVQTSKYGPCI